MLLVDEIGFNPRAREGATARTQQGKNIRFCFNPRAREGATTPHALKAPDSTVSIHAPVKARRHYLQDNRQH